MAFVSSTGLNSVDGRRGRSELLTRAGIIWSQCYHQHNPYDPRSYSQGLTDGYLRHAELIASRAEWGHKPAAQMRVGPSAQEYVRVWTVFSRIPPDSSDRQRLDATNTLVRAHQAFVRAFEHELPASAPLSVGGIVLRFPDTLQIFAEVTCNLLRGDDNHAQTLRRWLEEASVELPRILPALALLHTLSKLNPGQISIGALPEIFCQLDLGTLFIQYQALSEIDRKLLVSRLFEDTVEISPQAQVVFSTLVGIWVRLNREDYAAIVQFISNPEHLAIQTRGILISIRTSLRALKYQL